MARPPKALVFDLDGVLVLSEPLHRLTWLEAFAERGIEIRPDEERTLQGRTGEQVAQWLRSRGGAGAFDEQALILRKRELFEARFRSELGAVAGVDAFLRAQKPRLPLALVTSSGLKMVGQVMALFQWRNVFSALVGREHVAQTKPHPEPFLRAAERLKLRPEECLVFEDSAPGIEAARTAGAAVCGVATSLGAGELRAAGAHWAIQDFEDAAGLEMALAGLRPGKLVGWLRGLVE